LVDGFIDGNVGEDLFLWRRSTGTVVLLSHAHFSSTTSGNGRSEDGSINASGSRVAFVSEATDLVDGADGNGSRDVFLYLSNGSIQLVSREAGSPTPVAAGSASLDAKISANGQFVVFKSQATNLLSDVTDNNAGHDIFLWDRRFPPLAPTIALVSRSSGAATTTSNGISQNGVISSDGQFVAFESTGTNLPGVNVDQNGQVDVFVYERSSGSVTLVSHAAPASGLTANEASRSPGIDADGSFVAFPSSGTNLVAGQVEANGNPDLFLWSRESNSLELVSHQPGLPTTTAASGIGGEILLAASGGDVVFVSTGIDLVAGQIDSNNEADVFHWDRESSTITLVSHLPGNSVETGFGSTLELTGIGDGGRVVGFRSDSGDLLESPVSDSQVVAMYHAPQDFIFLDGFENGDLSAWE
jgi:hypothetical protein